MITPSNQSLSLLGTQQPVCCVNINWNGQTHLVCSRYFCGGGGTNPILPGGRNALLGDVQLYSSADLEGMSLSELNAYMATLQNEVAWLTNEIANNSGAYSANAIEGMQQAIIQFQAEIATVMDIINGTISPSQAPQQQQNYVNAYNTANNIANPNKTAGFFSQSIAGLPMWAVLGIGGLIVWKIL